MIFEPCAGLTEETRVPSQRPPRGLPRYGDEAVSGAEVSPGELADLIEEIAGNRCRVAFRRLFEHFVPRVKSFARRGGASSQAAEDLAQEVMLTVWRRAELFDRRKAAASTWIFTIARNRRIDMIRRESRPEFDPEDPSLEPSGPEPADEALQARVLELELRRAVADLPGEQAELMKRAYFEDRSHSDIAEELDLPLGTVKSRIRLAMRKLRKAMKEYER